jgi:cyclopropane-fatty-acyl-phospholipid synthase
MTTHFNPLTPRLSERHPAAVPALRGAPAAARTLLALLQRLSHGTLHVQWPDGSHSRHGTALAHEPSATLHIHHWRMCAQVLKSGDIGFAEAYIAGDWSTPQLVPLLRLCLTNRLAMEEAIYGRWWGQLGHRLRHLLNRNSKANARKNIHAHYDLGNAFYALWLDPTMNYSSAVFPPGTESMEEAQHAKVRRALRMAGVQPGDRVLEIGCGWGALAEMATTECRASVVGVTLSTEQLDWARQRLQALGVPTEGTDTGVKADLRLQDYRDIGVTTPDQPFDAICSIEMLEAVGQAYWPTYFQAVNRLLKPGGRACIQTITIADRLFDRYVRNTDFIQQYIFPGGCLPSPSAFRAQARAAGLEVVDELAFGQDYAQTLAWWHQRFVQADAQVRALGFDERFMRIWTYYLAVCEAAFAEGSTDVMQFTLRKPG